MKSIVFSGLVVLVLAACGGGEGEFVNAEVATVPTPDVDSGLGPDAISVGPDAQVGPEGSTTVPDATGGQGDAGATGSETGVGGTGGAAGGAGGAAGGAGGSTGGASGTGGSTGGASGTGGSTGGTGGSSYCPVDRPSGNTECSDTRATGCSYILSGNPITCSCLVATGYRVWVCGDKFLNCVSESVAQFCVGKCGWVGGYNNCGISVRVGCGLCS